MKILYLITKSEAGGAQTHVAELCRYFKSKGDEIVVMSASGGWLEKECNNIGAKFISNDYFSNSANPLLIYRAIKEIKNCAFQFKPDIIHCHSSTAAFLGRLAIRGKVKTIHTAHGWGFNEGVPWLQKWAVIFAEKLVSKYTHKIICVCKFVKELGVKYGISPEEKMEVVYNGVKVPEMISDRAARQNNKLKILFVGRLARPKLPGLLIDAFLSLPDDLKNKSEIIIVGDGPMLDKLKSKASFFGLDNNIFYGEKNSLELEEIYKKSDIFVLPTEWEGFPYVILEAMATGLPVIASGVGGIPEAVTEENGFVVKNIANDLSYALKMLIANDQLRLDMGIRGREIVQQKFAKESMLLKVESIYKEVINL